MIGTLINFVAILIGAILGLLLKKVLPERLGQPIMAIEGVAIIIIGLFGAASTMFTVKEGRLSSSGELLLLVSLVVGTIIGELIRIDDALNGMADKIEKKIHIDGFSKGFVSASLVFSVGAMTIMGPMNEVLSGDMSLLLIKSMLDATTALLLTVTLGYGVLFSGIPVVIIQGVFAFCAQALSTVSAEILNEVFMVGYTIVFCIGINFVVGNKIKTANVLPALLVPIVYNVLKLIDLF